MRLGCGGCCDLASDLLLLGLGAAIGEIVPGHLMCIAKCHKDVGA
jgi:hypothetical protein